MAAHQKVRQVWFAGMHTDVGGGYAEQGLSDIPLVWLTQQAVGHGLRIYPRHNVKIAEDADAMMHNSRGEGVKKLFRRKTRLWDTERADKPVIHQSVLDRNLNPQNQADPPYRPWILDHDHEVEPWVRLPELDWGGARET